jgi:hypothetical protein
MWKKKKKNIVVKKPEFNTSLAFDMVLEKLILEVGMTHKNRCDINWKSGNI